jgi:hypothetical protein
MNNCKNSLKTPSESDIYGYFIYSVSRECIKMNLAGIAFLCALLVVI